MILKMLVNIADISNYLTTRGQSKTFNSGFCYCTINAKVAKKNVYTF